MTPTDHDRIATLAESTWADVPEARPTFVYELPPSRKVPKQLKHGDRLRWFLSDQFGESSVWAAPIHDEHAIALIESACLHHIEYVNIRLQGGGWYEVGYSPAEDEWDEITAPTLVEALLMAVRAKGKKEPTRE